jgi:hypothetical protein
MKANEGSGRLPHVDDARSLAIFLVVMVHASVTYSGIGGWYVTENRPESLGMGSLLAFGLFNSFSQAWFMGILFFFGGVFAADALARKGLARFVRDRVLRLALPLVAYVFVITPLLYYFLVSPGIAREGCGFWELYRSRYIGSGMFLSGNGPLWFAETLLAFSLVFAFVRLVAGSFRSRAGESSVPRREPPSTRVFLAFALAVAVAAFLVRIRLPIGTSWLNLQFCFFASYVALFVLGVRASDGGWFAAIASRRYVRWWWAAFWIGVPVWLAIMAVGGPLHGDMESIGGGLRWQSAAYSLWESFVAVAMTLGLTAFLAGRRRQGGAISAFLSRNSFSVFFFHPAFLIGLTRLFADWTAHPVAKALIVGSLAYSATLVFAELVVRRIPGVRRYF